jgi:hypothetical protein
MGNIALKEKVDDIILEDKQDTFELVIEDSCFLRVIPFSSKVGEGYDIRKYFKRKSQQDFFPSRKGMFLTTDLWIKVLPELCRLVNFYPERPK